MERSVPFVLCIPQTSQHGVKKIVMRGQHGIQVWTFVVMKLHGLEYEICIVIGTARANIRRDLECEGKKIGTAYLTETAQGP